MPAHSAAVLCRILEKSQTIFFSTIYVFSWMDLGQFEKAKQLFEKSYQPYVRKPFNV